MQKIKYPVGSKLKNDNSEIEFEITDILSSGLICFGIDEDGAGVSYTQLELDEFSYTLISSPRWVPEMGEQYYFIMSSGCEDSYIWENKDDDIFRLKSGNAFKTPEECQKKIGEINSREI